ncbi:MAG: Smr/MutS family protein [Hyphomicrobiaceae bacterium]
MASVDRRRKGKRRVPDVEAESDAAPAGSPTQPPTAPGPQRLQKAAAKTPPPRREAPPAASPRAATAASARPGSVPGVDRRKARRIAAGTIEIEARLDLHGLTQSAAHGRLAGFLQKASARGLRTVLVITGKGGTRQQPASPAAGWWETEEVGVLRRSVPRWLAEPPLRAIVIGCQPAAAHHGGEGALYILLRRRKIREQD